ncbi:acid protease [Pyrrhoderma noxium]|uniref:Acid protease n=1 Tax=Pyrrhoderma noxium TaxID=2282107 RepID=A0A286UTP7_9AGAM|nr:acid protease [Pyrrhoderma noxium]
MFQGWVFHSLMYVSVFVLAQLCRVMNASPTSHASITNNQDGLKEPRKKMHRSGVLELPLHRVERPDQTKRRRGVSATGLGDAFDITYNVQVKLGNDRELSLVLDTGSADLWVLSINCSTCLVASDDKNTSNDNLLYDNPDFESVADARLLYGDSRTGTHAYGVIGKDTVSVAGLAIYNQFFAAINDTDTSILNTGSSGLFGFGFPVNSILWNELYTRDTSLRSSSNIERRIFNPHPRSRSLPIITIKKSVYENLVANKDTVYPVTESNDDNNEKTPSNILSSFSDYGPLIPRLILDLSSTPSASPLQNPQFTITLERTAFSSVSPSGMSGAVGQLTIGGLPPTFQESTTENDLFWTPVRSYTPAQSGISISEAPGEAYPYAWDIPVEAVYFNGVKLPSTTLGDVTVNGVGESALIDTGNSLIRGPADVIATILALLLNTTDKVTPSVRGAILQGNPSEEDYEQFTSNFDVYTYAYPCASAQSLVFEFGGIGKLGNFNLNISDSTGGTRKFKVDARDFGRPIYTEKDNGKWCIPNLAPTDAPELGGYLYSWSLGEPFLRGVLASFWFGNLTNPSRDGAKIGFLSTVPGWSGEIDDETEDVSRLQEAVYVARNSGYPNTLITAPTGTWSSIPVTTDPYGVVYASLPPIISPVLVDSLRSAYFASLRSG